jgi:hypothetical protein
MVMEVKEGRVKVVAAVMVERALLQGVKARKEVVAEAAAVSMVVHRQHLVTWCAVYPTTRPKGRGFRERSSECI